MRDKRLIAFAILLVILLAFILENYFKFLSTITGMLGVISLSVASTSESVVSIFSVPSSANTSFPMTFFVEFKNVGSETLAPQVLIEVKNSNFQTISTLTSENITMHAGSTKMYSPSFTPTTGGAHFAFAKMTFDGKTVEKNNSFEVIAPPAPSPTYEPTAAPTFPFILPTEYYREMKIVHIIYEYTPTDIAVLSSDILKIMGVEITTNKVVSDVQIIFKESVKSIEIPPPITTDTGSVLKYVEVSKVNIKDEDIGKVKIKFKVENSWITSNDIDTTSVALQRVEKNKWNKLPTKMVGSDANFHFYEAESPGLSLFSITGEKRFLTLDFPDRIKLNRGQSFLINISVENMANTDVSNLILTTFSKEIALEVTPLRIENLPVNSSALFLISGRIPRDLSPAIYPINFTLTTNKVTKSGEILIEVEALKIEQEIEQSIKNYQSLIDKLSEEGEKAKGEGRDIAIALEHLENAKREIENSRKLYISQQYDAAIESLEAVKRDIESSVGELAKTTRPPVVFIPIPFPRPELVGALATGLGGTFALYYRQKKEDEKYRKSIRYAIQIIKNRGS